MGRGRPPARALALLPIVSNTLRDRLASLANYPTDEGPMRNIITLVKDFTSWPNPPGSMLVALLRVMYSASASSYQYASLRGELERLFTSEELSGTGDGPWV